jgi:hypothetical protein
MMLMHYFFNIFLVRVLKSKIEENEILLLIDEIRMH